MPKATVGGWRSVVVLLVLVGTSACARHAVVPQWDAKAFRELDTLEFLTNGPTEGPQARLNIAAAPMSW